VSAVEPVQSGGIDWGSLREAAHEAMQRAYVPYSRFPVGVAAIATDGRVITGCNVENASYGLTLCAECALVSVLHLTGGGQLLMPCGRCRQLLFEHAVPGMLLETVSGIRTIDEVLPDAFGPSTLDAYGDRA
jgi:cytidine deaminase